MNSNTVKIDNRKYVKWFRNSAPYINAHRGKTFVLMFGGEAVEHPNFPNIIHDIALLNSLGVKLVLVYGARPQIEQRAKLRGVEARFADDIRITDEQSLECVKDAAGSLRSHIEALLTMGLANSPMHGAHIRVCSGNFVMAKPLGILDGIDYEHTGMVRRIDIEGIRRHLSEGTIVLLSPTGYSPTGEVFNLSLEDIAAQTAIRLKADKLIVMSKSPGLFDESNKLIPSCGVSTVRSLLNDSKDSQTKSELRAIVGSSDGGVSRCHCVSYIDDGALLQELFTRQGSGTLIAKDHNEHLRIASIDDVGGILELIAPLEADGSLVKRSRELLENEIGKFSVMEFEGMIIACAALYPYTEPNCGEIACVATSPDYRGEDRGERMLASLEARARDMHLESVFVLTTQTAHWFLEQGYSEASRNHLPAQKMYNLQRNSKVFIKKLT